MPRFVILTHDHPFLHWDFMLQRGEALRTWRLLKEPESGGEIPAEPLGDHRIDYLDYEGPVSGNRGEVTRWDSGEFTVIEETANQMRVHLSGPRLKGTAVLQHLALRTQHSANWTFYFTPD